MSNIKNLMHKIMSTKFSRHLIPPKFHFLLRIRDGNEKEREEDGRTEERLSEEKGKQPVRPPVRR